MNSVLRHWLIRGWSVWIFAAWFATALHLVNPVRADISEDAAGVVGALQKAAGEIIQPDRIARKHQTEYQAAGPRTASDGPSDNPAPFTVLSVQWPYLPAGAWLVAWPENALLSPYPSEFLPHPRGPPQP